jgi:ABC-type transport system involved in multi-copper enzyme maturation permease subunit
MRNFFKLVGVTIADLVHNKSFYVMLTISVVFVLLLRGCYKQDFTVNGQHLDATAVAWHASIIAFHIIAAGALFIALLLSLGAFKRDSDDGSLVYLLASPIKRDTYVLARITGQWLISFVFMLILHVTIVIIALVNTGGFIPGYVVASLVCSVNVLFIVVVTSFFSLLLPVFASALISLGIAAISFGSDTFFTIVHKTGLSQSLPETTLWRIVWPKVSALQYYAVSLINHSGFQSIGPIPPLVNVLLWTVFFGVLLVWRFRKEDL